MKCERALFVTVGKYSRYGGSARRVPRRGQGVHGAAKGTCTYNTGQPTDIYGSSVAVISSINI